MWFMKVCFAKRFRLWLLLLSSTECWPMVHLNWEWSDLRQISCLEHSCCVAFAGFVCSQSNEVRLQVSTVCSVSAKIARVLTRNIFNQAVCQLQVTVHGFQFLVTPISNSIRALRGTYQSRKQSSLNVKYKYTLGRIFLWLILFGIN